MRLTSHHLELPDRMRSKLEAYRQRIWTVKLAEGLLAAIFGLLASYLLIFALDRFWVTPAWLRAIVLASASLGFGICLPLKWHRWVWRTRHLSQAARLLRRKFPKIGDQLQLADRVAPWRDDLSADRVYSPEDRLPPDLNSIKVVE